MTRRNAELLLAALIIARSTSYILTKTGLEAMGPFTLLAIRFLLAFALLVMIFWKRFIHLQIQTLLRGMLLGLVFFAVMTAELFGLQTTSSSMTAFLENTAIVFVPIFEAILRKKLPTASVYISSAVTLLGVGLLTLHGNTVSLTQGELLCLLAALLYAAAIILTDRLAVKDDPFILGMLQVGFLGLFSLFAAFLFETPRLPSSGQEWAIIIALAIVCTGFGFTLQPVAQRYTSSERTGIFCALNPLVAAVLGWIILNERLGYQGIIGATLILLGLTASYLIKKPDQIT
ncbi:MAG: EamA family transporter [Alphaproteobacteria bacterium]